MDELLTLIGVMIVLGGALVFLALFAALFRKAARQERTIEDLRRGVKRLRHDLEELGGGRVSSAEPPPDPAPATPRESVTTPGIRRVRPVAAPVIPVTPPPDPAAVTDTGAVPEPEVSAPVGPPPLPASRTPMSATDSGETIVAEPEPRDETPAKIPHDDVPLAAMTDPEVSAAVEESLELKVGQKLFNRIGIGVLVIGIALLLRHYVPFLGPWGKIITVALTGLGMLAGGLSLQARERYRHAAMGLMAGGWAVLYALAYGVHNIEAVKVIDDKVWGFVLLVWVASGMILHSLRHKTQAITGLSFLFAVVGMTFSPPGPWIPVAIGILGLAQIIVSRFPPYNDLGPVAVLVTYAAQLFWLLSTDQPVPASIPWLFLVQAACFALTAAAVPHVENRHARRAGVTGLLNLGGAFGLVMLAEGSIGHPGPWSYPLFLAVVALVEGWMRWQRGRSLRLGVFSLAAATVLTMVTVLWAFSAGWSQVIWIAMALVMSWLGNRYRAPALAGLGAAILGISLLWILSISVGYVSTVIPLGPLEPRWTLLIVAVASHGFRVLTRGTRVGSLGARMALVGTATAVIWVPLEAPEALGTMFLALFALLLVGFASWQRDSLVRLHGLGVAIIGGAAGLMAHVEELRRSFPDLVALPMEGTLWGLPAPMVWTLAPAIALYVLWWVRWPHEEDVSLPLDQHPVLATMGLGLVLALLYTLCPSTVLSVVGAALALALVCAAGPMLGKPLLTLHGLAVALLAGAHLFLVNFTTTEHLFAGLTLRHGTVVPVLAVLLYLRHRPLADGEALCAAFPRHVRGCHELSGFLVMAIAATLVSYELTVSMVASAWALIALAGIWIGSAVRDRGVTLSACILMMLAAVRGVAVHPGLAGSFFGIPVHPIATLPVVVGLVLAGERLRSIRLQLARERDAEPFLAAMMRRAPQIYPLLLILFVGSYIYNWVSGPMLTFAWSLEAAVVLALGFILRSRPHRLCALGLVAFCLGKVFLVDLAGAEPKYKILSFVILGVVMIGISFLYARFRDKIAEYI